MIRFALLVIFALSSSLIAEEASLYPVSREGTWGFIDNKGNVVIQPRFLTARNFSEGVALVSVAGTTEEDRVFDRTYQGFIDSNGKFVVPPRPPKGLTEIDGFETYSYGDFQDGMARIHINDGTGVDGFIDRRGNLTIKPQFSTACDFSEGLAFVSTEVPTFMAAFVKKKKERNGFVNKQGKFIIENKSMNYSYGFEEGRAYVSITNADDDEQHGLIDRSGKFVIPLGIYDALDNPKGGAIRAEKDDKIGMINTEGIVTVPFGKYEQITPPTEGTVFVAESAGRTFLIESTGKQLAEVSQEGDVGIFQYGMATIKNNDHVGFIDASGKTAIPLNFDKASGFHRELALVTQGKTKGYINRSGEFVWKTDRWDEPIRNAVSKPLSTFLPETVIEALPLSYNWDGVKNAIVFVADGNLKQVRTWYQKRCTGKIKLTDHSEPAKIDLMISGPDVDFVEVFVVDGNAKGADGFIGFYSCDNMKKLRRKHPKKTIGIVIEN